jgi:hypothetical protein
MSASILSILPTLSISGSPKIQGQLCDNLGGTVFRRSSTALWSHRYFLRMIALLQSAASANRGGVDAILVTVTKQAFAAAIIGAKSLSVLERDEFSVNRFWIPKSIEF